MELAARVGPERADVERKDLVEGGSSNVKSTSVLSTKIILPDASYFAFRSLRPRTYWQILPRPLSCAALVPLRVVRMPTMNVSLTAEMVEFVESQVARGDYVSASEVVRDALRVMLHERENESLKLKLLRSEIDLGFRDVEANRFSDRSVADIARSILDESDD